MTSQQDTEALIAALGRAPAPEPLRRGGGLLGLIAAALALGMGAVLGVLGLRLDLGAALAVPLTAAKTLLPLGLAALALPLLRRSTRPEGRAPLWPFLAPAALAAALFGARALALAPAARPVELMGGTAAACLLSITLISAGPLGAGLWALRRGASTRPARTGALLGLAVGALATVGYSLHCTEDSPMFYVTWYGLAIALMTALGALAGARLLRW